MADHKQIARYLESILKSQCFSKSGINRELLRYLVDATIKGENPKEFQIANEVFGKNVNHEKDLNIRVYILNLRKKLEEYYEREGKDDEVRFLIPKGKYNVQFNTNYYKIYSRRLFRIAPALFVLSVLLLASTFFLYRHRRGPETARLSFWKELRDGGYPILLILGDHYFFRLNSKNEVSGTMRINNINNDSELDQYITGHPELIDRIEKTSQTYINTQAPFGIYKIMNVLGGGLADINMIYSSQLRWSDLPGNHVIFIGSYKTQNLLQPINEKIGIYYDVRQGLLNYTTADSVIRFRNHSLNNLMYEYASLVHFVTGDGRKIIFFMCDSDVGNIATLKMLTEKQGLLQLENAVIQKSSQNYKAVFEVKGRDRTDFETNLLRVDPLEIPISEVWP
ncbi:MAG: hypothetical protein RBS73_11865 [Prolixibacteraceae bacterium]|jgi:hypothetical protein|nr:hypothetical protein [Prolixibacteraceae bacterium]